MKRLARMRPVKTALTKVARAKLSARSERFFAEDKSICAGARSALHDVDDYLRPQLSAPHRPSCTQAPSLGPRLAQRTEAGN